MKFKHIADYLLQPDIAGALICCQLEMTLGRRRNAQYGLIKLFKRLKFNATVRADVNSRGRERILGEAAVWLADSFLSESKAADGVALFRQLLTKNPRADPLYRGLCRLVFPGDNYVQILKALHREFKPKFYVEIGVNKGDSLLCVMPSTDAVGIDPNPRIARAISRNIAIFPETSDAFFAAYKTRPQFYDRKIDFAYIDGLHHFEQALRDFINIEKRAAIGGMIALHDCIPFDEINSSRDYDTLHWVGDVWKNSCRFVGSSTRAQHHNYWSPTFGSRVGAPSSAEFTDSGAEI